MPTYKRRISLKTLITSKDDCPVEISKDEYLKITEGFMKFISKKILNGKEVDLPSKTGTILVAGRKQIIKVDDEGKIKGAATNWKATIALWEKDAAAKEKKTRIYHFNEHSNGNRYKFFWLNTYTNMNNKSLFVFKITRKNARSLWKRILDGFEYRIFKPVDYDKNQYYIDEKKRKRTEKIERENHGNKNN